MVVVTQTSSGQRTDFMLLMDSFLLEVDASQAFFLSFFVFFFCLRPCTSEKYLLLPAISLTRIHIDTSYNRCFDRNKCWYRRHVRSAVQGTVEGFQSHPRVRAISFDTRCRPACNQINKQCRVGGTQRAGEEKTKTLARENVQPWMHTRSKN